MELARPGIRHLIVKRMSGQSAEVRQWLCGATIGQTTNGFWMAWHEHEANRIGLLPQGTPRTRGCIWLQDGGRRSFEQWYEYIESGLYEQELLREELVREDARAPSALQSAERHRQSAELASPRFILTRAEAALAVGISISTLERLVRLGQFPQPRLLSAGRVGWLTREIEAWAESRPCSYLLPPPNTGASKSRRKLGLQPI